jgi:hypothetical protein
MAIIPEDIAFTGAAIFEGAEPDAYEEVEVTVAVKVGCRYAGAAFENGG